MPFSFLQVNLLPRHQAFVCPGAQSANSESDASPSALGMGTASFGSPSPSTLGMGSAAFDEDEEELVELDEEELDLSDESVGESGPFGTSSD